MWAVCVRVAQISVLNVEAPSSTEEFCSVRLVVLLLIFLRHWNRIP